MKPNGLVSIKAKISNKIGKKCKIAIKQQVELQVDYRPLL